MQPKHLDAGLPAQGKACVALAAGFGVKLAVVLLALAVKGRYKAAMTRPSSGIEISGGGGLYSAAKGSVDCPAAIRVSRIIALGVATATCRAITLQESVKSATTILRGCHGLRGVYTLVYKFFV